VVSRVTPTKDINTKDSIKDIYVDSNKPLTDIQRIVERYKEIKGVSKDDKEWNDAYFPRFTKSAKQLISICKSYESALKCLNQESEKLEDRGLTWCLETIVKWSGDWYNKAEKNRIIKQQDAERLRKLSEMSRKMIKSSDYDNEGANK